MVLFILAYLGGVLTILSPCIPVLPQSRAERRPGDTRQVGGNEGIGHDVKPVYLVLKGFESGWRATNAANSSPPAAGVTAPKNPMAGSLPACCARGASGHAAAATPSSVMNARRLLIRSPRRRGRAA